MSAETVTYRVADTWPMLQIASRNPRSRGSVSTGAYEQTQRTFRNGDVLPGWLEDWEIQHLLGINAIERVA